MTFPAATFALDERVVMGSCYGSPRFWYDVPRVLDLYRAGRIRLDDLVSRRLPLDEINAAIALLEEGEVARSVVVYPPPAA